MDGGFADDVAYRIVEQARFLSFRPGMFKYRRVIHTCGAGARAGQTSQAEIDFLRESPGHWHFPVGDGTGQGHTSPGAVPLAFGF